MFSLVCPSQWSEIRVTGFMWELGSFRLPSDLLFVPPPPGALTKAKESQKDRDVPAAHDIHERCNIISCATLAEIQHFHRTRVRDFKAQMQHYLLQQISFFQRITAKLEEALHMYDQA